MVYPSKCSSAGPRLLLFMSSSFPNALIRVLSRSKTITFWLFSMLPCFLIVDIIRSLKAYKKTHVS